MTGISRRQLLMTGAAAGGALVGLAATPAVAGTGVRRRAAGAMVTGETWLADRVVDVTVRSDAMEDELPVRLIVPASWSRRGAGPWPVLYLLHGGRDDYTSWTRETDVVDLVADSDVLVAMPEGGRAGFYSDWWNFGAGGPPAWETFHLGELTSLLEDRYGAARVRAVAGLSSGGQGALVYAARHPGMFRFAGSFSGLASNSAFGVPEMIMELLATEHFHPQALWGHPTLQADLWRDHDATALAAGLRGTHVFVSCGRMGQPAIFPPADWWDTDNLEAVTASTMGPFITQLRRHGVAVDADLYPDGHHSWPYWEQELHACWPLIVGSLGGALRRR